MKGQNIIKMNVETMNTAVQYYLNNVVLKEPVVVESVKHKDSNYDETFEVTTVRQESPEKGPSDAKEM